MDSSRAVTGADVVDAAKRYLGTPYVCGGTNPESGLDCSGLVQRVYADLGVKLPRVAKDQAREGTAVAGPGPRPPRATCSPSAAPVDHVGIYLGDGRMIAAPHAGDVVKIQQVYETPTAIRRIVPTTSLDPSAGAAGCVVSRPGRSCAAAALRPASLTGVPYADLFQQAGAKYGLAPRSSPRSRRSSPATTRPPSAAPARRGSCS